MNKMSPDFNQKPSNTKLRRLALKHLKRTLPIILGLFTFLMISGYDTTKTGVTHEEIVKTPLATKATPPAILEILTDCSITKIDVTNISSCQNNGTTNAITDDFITMDINLMFTNPPSSGSLKLKGHDGAMVSVSDLDAATGHTFTAIKVPADGSVIDIKAYFTANASCMMVREKAVMAPSQCSSDDCDNDGLPDKEEADCDNDGIPDDCENDTDNDRIPDDCDNCPNTPNPTQADEDQDGLGDVCDGNSCEQKVDAGDDLEICKGEEVTLTATSTGTLECKTCESYGDYPVGTKIFRVKDVDPQCSDFDDAGTGVLFQCNDNQGFKTWKAMDDLTYIEFPNRTAKIMGRVQSNGETARLEVDFDNFNANGSSYWQAVCYMESLVAFDNYLYKGSLAVDGGETFEFMNGSSTAYANIGFGASNDGVGYGIGAWPRGSIGNCSEFFAKLELVCEIQPEKKVSYLWSTGETTPSITVSPNVSTTYTVTVTHCDSCKISDEVIVTVKEVPNNIVEEQFVCHGESFTWTFGEVTHTATVADGTKTLHLKADNGCMYTATLTVKEFPKTNDDKINRKICEGTTVEFLGQNYEKGEYTIERIDENGCAFNTTLIVETFEGVTANAGDNVSICKGDEVTLTGTGEGTFIWSNGATTKSITVSPSVSTVYSFSVTSANGCTATDTVTVTVINKVTIGDFVWEDINKNGIQESGEPGVKGVKATLFECESGQNQNGTMRQVTHTDNNGNYYFEVCPSKEYYIEFDLGEAELNDLAFYKFAPVDIGTNERIDSDAKANGRTDCFTTNNDDFSIDAGIFKGKKLFLANKIRPRDPSSYYELRGADTACLNDDLYLKVYKDGGPNHGLGDGLEGYVFTWKFPNGETYVTNDGTCGDCLASWAKKEIYSNLSLQDEDFGKYSVAWVAPDGEEGVLEFNLSKSEQCGLDGRRTIAQTRINHISPNPIGPGELTLIEINISNTKTIGSTANLLVNKRNEQNQLRHGEEVLVTLYSMNGQMVSKPKSFKINGHRGVIEYKIDYVTAGNYILRISGNGWQEAKRLLVH